MSHWLVKSDPEDYSFDDLERDRRTVWDGIRNSQALQYIRQMKKGELTLVYHSGKSKSIVGLAEIVRGPYPDPDAEDDSIVVFELEAKERLSQPVALSDMKADRTFSDFHLVRQPRLSVMPVSPVHWDTIMKMAAR